MPEEKFLKLGLGRERRRHPKKTGDHSTLAVNRQNTHHLVMPDFFTFAAGVLGKLGISLAGREIGEKIKDARTKRRMERMVEDAVDRIVEQIDGFLTGENVNEHRKQVLISSLCFHLQPLTDDPQKFFAGNLDGQTIFKQVHPDGKLPEEVCEEDLGHFYTMLFPQIAHFLAGSRVALQHWQAEGFREEFKRLTQIAEEIRAMNVKVADLPATVAQAFGTKADKEAESLLREFSQTLLNTLLLRLDLSPLRAERALHGSLRDHFVIPAFCERKGKKNKVVKEKIILGLLASPGARRIVHGVAGVGKTTWSLWLQSRLLESEPGRVAVVFRLREVIDIENRSLLDLLKERAGAHLRDGLTDKVLRKWHANGRLVVILDGFDEVPEDRRDAVEKWVKGLDPIAKKTAIIITSRPLQSGHLETLKRPWQQWDLLTFDEMRIVEFIERWHRYLPEGELAAAERQVDGRILAMTFLSDPSLRPLANTPLMLGTLLFVHHRDKKLPNGRVDLYERYIGAMLGLRDSGMGVHARATNLTDREKRRVLGHIALHFHLNHVDEVNDDTMCSLVTEALAKFKLDEDVERLLPALHERTGLLQGPGAWSFMHKTIGEFLVAELVCEGTTRFPNKRRLDRKELWKHRHKDAWTNILFFWAGKTTAGELEEFIEELLDEVGGKGTLLALALLDDQGDRLESEMQRSLALRMISKPMSDKPKPDHSTYCVMAVVPKIADAVYESPAFELRGLSGKNSTMALQKPLLDGVLTLQDLKTCHESFRAPLTNAAVWLSSETNFIPTEMRQYLWNLPEDKLELYSISYSLGQTLPNEPIQKLLGIFIEAFPKCRAKMPFMLLGSVSAFKGHESWPAGRFDLVGQSLWEWRNEPVDEAWLCFSENCSHNKIGSHDLLLEMCETLEKNDFKAWKITPGQHADLVTWCNRMIARRNELKTTSAK